MEFIFMSCMFTCALYSLLLAVLKRTRWNYEPDHTWVTVVVGNAIIGLHFLWLQTVAPTSGIEAFWGLVSLNVAGGGPVIAWQAIENALRVHDIAQPKSNQ